MPANRNRAARGLRAQARGDHVVRVDLARMAMMARPIQTELEAWFAARGRRLAWGPRAANGQCARARRAVSEWRRACGRAGNLHDRSSAERSLIAPSWALDAAWRVQCFVSIVATLSSSDGANAA